MSIEGSLGKGPEQVAPKSEFYQKLEGRWQQGNFVCVGLDSDFKQFPELFKLAHNKGDAIFSFNRQIVDATADLVCAYKPNSAFYEALGREGWDALSRTTNYIKNRYPEIPVILDAKRADIGNTNNGYVEAAFDVLRADAITIHPYLGKEAMKPFLDRKDKGVIVLCRTSNPGAGEFQDFGDEYALGKMIGPSKDGHLYEKIARSVATEWNYNGNCALVVGATYPEELRNVRWIAGDLPILLPGIGAQGGDVEATVKAGRDSKNQGMIINSSRGIIFASKGNDFAQAARIETQKLHDSINQFRLAA